MGDIPRRGKEHHIVEAGHVARHTQEDNTGPTTTTTLTAKIITSRTFLHGQIIRDMMSEGKKLIGYKTSTAAPTMPSNVGTRKKENLDRYCDYHGEKGHYTNDCYQLKRQLEATLKFGKLGHLVKDVRQRGGTRGRQHRNNNGKGKMINMVWVRGDSQKCKYQKIKEEDWMNTPITFPPIPPNDVSDEPLIIEAKVEDATRRGVRATHHHTPMNEVFLTPKGIAALVTRTAAVFECRHLEEKQIIPEEKADGKGLEDKEKLVEKEILVNPTFPEQRVTIGIEFSKECRLQLIKLLKDNKDVFTWQPSDTIRVLKRIIQHSLNVNLSVPPEAQKRRVLCPEKSRAVMKEFEE
ncbi:hypothetical protein Tco_1381283 [Tanacetum coccineum]